MTGRALPLFLATFVLAGALAIGMKPAHADLQCIATLSPDTVLRGTDPVNVTYSLSEPIGSIEGVIPDEGSGIVVSAVDSTQSALTLDTNTAEAGSWQLTFHGSEQRSCTGRIHVAGIQRLR